MTTWLPTQQRKSHVTGTPFDEFSILFDVHQTIHQIAVHQIMGPARTRSIRKYQLSFFKMQT